MKKTLKGVADFFRSEEPKGKKEERLTGEPRPEPQVNGMEPEKKEEIEPVVEGEEKEPMEEERVPEEDLMAEIEVPVEKGTPGADGQEQEKEKDAGDTEFSMKEKIIGAMKQYCLDRSLPPHIYDGMKDAFCKIAEDCGKGELSDRTVCLLHYAASYVESVEDARKEGRIAGRNEAIEEKLRSEEHPDDIPSLGGTATGSDNLPRTSIFDLARGAV